MNTLDSTARITVPGQQTFWTGPIVPPLEVRLPLVARARLPWVIVGVLTPFALLGLFALAMVLMRPFMTVASLSVVTDTLTMAAMALLAALGLLSMAMIVTAFADWGRDQPLVVTAEGIEDRRSGAPAIAWSDVERAQVFYRGPGLTPKEGVFIADACVFGVLLSLRREIDARHNPFRHGAHFRPWRRPPNELYVPVVNLSVSPHELAYTMLALVRRHGGAIEPRLPDHDPGPR